MTIIKHPLPWIIGLVTVVVIPALWFVPTFIKTPHLIKQTYFSVNNAYALTLSDSKELYVSDFNNNVYILNLSGKQLRHFTVKDTYIRGIRSKPGTKEMYIAKWGNEQIQVFNTQGKKLRSFKSTDQAMAHGFVFFPNGEYLVSDNHKEGAVLFNANDTQKSRFIKSGNKPGELSRPRQLAYDSINKHIYVTDRDNNRIQIFDRQGKYIRGLGDSTTNGGKFNKPHGIALDLKNKRVYVGDTYNHRIVVYSLDGRYMAEYKDPSFKEPRWIAVDESTGKVYVASFKANQVGVFDIVWKW